MNTRPLPHVAHLAARLFLLSFAAAAFSTSAALTAYLKIGDIQGESQAVDHEEEIDVHDVSWGMRQPRDSAAGTGRARARVEVGALTVRKYIDAATPYLALSTMNGQSFPEVTLTLRKDTDDGGHLDYLIITMENVVISAYNMDSTATAGDIPEEEVSFIFEKVTYRYVTATGDEHEIEYDIAAGV